MLKTGKKIFFMTVFGILYISFVAQFVYILGWVSGIEYKLTALGFLSVEWLVLMLARHFAKKSGNGMQHGGYGGNRRR